MLVSQSRKNKIDLADYDFEQDITTRLFLADLTLQEFEVLEEILNSSLKISLPILANNCERKEDELSPILERLSQIGLLSLEEGVIHVNKEKRKVFEAETQKLESDFDPGMHYLQTLLRKVPIEILPVWYAISRSADNIFESIVEKYLETPKVYRKYLSDLVLDEEVLHGLAKEILDNPAKCIPADQLQEKFGLSPEEFHRCMLLLEFSFVGCLVYHPTSNGWEERVTTFSEWRDYISPQADEEPQPLIKEEDVTPLRKEPFAFTGDMTSLLEIASERQVEVVTGKKGPTLSEELIGELVATQMISLCGDEEKFVSYADYLSAVIEKLVRTKLAVVEEDTLVPHELAKEWMGMTPQERAQNLYLHPCTKQCLLKCFDQTFSERDFLSLEKWLTQYIDAGWVTFPQLLKTMELPIGSAEPVTLKKTGARRWAYVPPQYTEQEVAFIKGMIFRRFFELGITQVGKVNGKDCFRLTPYGEGYLRRSFSTA